MAYRKRAGALSARRRPKTSTRRALPTVSIVGAGRLGTALGLALARCGYTIEAVVAARKSHARAAAAHFSIKPLALSASELDHLPASAILIISTPDDKIRETARAIASTIEERGAVRTALHTSGALSSDELMSLRDAGVRIGSMHPLVAVSDAVSGADSLSRAFFCLEGERVALRVARKIVRSLGARSFHIDTREKSLYHAAAVMASGHTVALFDIATEMLVRCGLAPKEARSLLLPLLRSTLDNLSKHEPSRALTGTFARADLETVRRHLQAIKSSDVPYALAAYTLLGRRSLQLARRRAVDEGLLEELTKALSL
jgi:predicted short-subunit dehydrogenase-like oxidoreductase (DUF2520 family)